ncbi:MAG: RNA polymerase sigma-70 factor [Methyloglobulus sp.]|nr:RNA polymerase sigma-70 factor [Methyloglobulus sp.]
MCFENLYREQHKKAINLASYIVNDYSVAEEISQECFFTLYQTLKTRQLENPGGYLFQAIKNSAFDYLKHQKIVANHMNAQEVYDERVQTNASPEQLVEDEEYLRLIKEVIEELPPKCRNTLMLNKFYGMSYSEIAQATGISESGVEKNMMRGLKHCRKSIPEFNSLGLGVR